MPQEKVYTIAEYHELRGRLARVQSAGHAALDSVLPRAQPVEAPPPRERTDVTLLREIQRLAKQHGWRGQHTARGETDEELECLLVREGLVYVVVQTDTAKLTAKQLAWIEALRATGSIEVLICRPSTLPDLTARLARKRGG